MRVAMVSTGMSRAAGGVFYAVRDMAGALTDTDCEVEVFAGHDHHFEADRADWEDVPAHPLPVQGPMSFGFQGGLRRALNRLDPDVLHLHGLWTYPSIATALWRGPTIISPHGMLDPWAVRNAAWKKRLAYLLYEGCNLRRAACIHALNEAEYVAVRHYGLTNPVAVIPIGVTPPSPTERGTNSSPWARKIPQGSRVLLYLGRIHPKKGLAELVGAMGALKRRKAAEGWHVVVAGWDQHGHRRALEALRMAEDVVDRVVFIGPCFGPDKHRILADADAFVLPSFSEGMPVAVLEAWSYGLPVLMTPACNLPEGFADGAAIRIEPEIDSIAAGIEALDAMPPAALAAMARSAEGLVRQRFDWASVGQKLCAVYTWMLGEGARPDAVRVA
jgi:glycosyltransferase involved in cell wall biosynthesis